MYQLNQKELWISNACSAYAILTNLMNEFKTPTTIEQRREYIEFVWLEGQGSLPSAMVNKALQWRWKTFFPVQHTMYTATQMIDVCKRWRMCYIWFRRTEDMFNDLTSDWKLDRVPEWRQEWWHSCNLIFKDWLFYIIDNYFWIRKYNMYSLTEEQLRQMITKRIIRWSCYVFSLLNKKKRILKIK